LSLSSGLPSGFRGSDEGRRVNFNDQQRDAIEIRDHAIVAAGAGSGKTSVLVERYAALISDDGCSVESLLCLTFTRKAAGEMYERIYSRLSGIGDSPGGRGCHRQFRSGPNHHHRCVLLIPYPPSPG
jgi:superfamily I DNA/RNA helicase